jgi:cytochrome c oxidase subunit 2
VTFAGKGRLIALAALLATASFGAYRTARSPEPHIRVVRIAAQRFEYDPERVVLKRGEPVVLEFSSRDVVMGFNLPDFGMRTDIVPGRVTRIRFVPDKVGTFTFLCDVFCGAGHEQMEGTIEVID